MERTSFDVGQRGWVGKGAPGQAGGLRFGGRRGTADCLPVLGLAACRRTHFACSAALHSNRRRQVSLRSALRARATRPVLLSASEAPSGLSGHAFAEAFWVFAGRANAAMFTGRALALRGKPSTVAARQEVPGRGDFWGGEERSPEVGRACAHQYLTRRGCLSAMSAANVASSAAPTSGRAPQRSRRTRRPPQHEPLLGTACRAAQTVRMRSTEKDGPS